MTELFLYTSLLLSLDPLHMEGTTAYQNIYVFSFGLIFLFLLQPCINKETTSTKSTKNIALYPILTLK